MSRDVNKLKQQFRASVKQLIKEAKDQGIPVLVTDTTRTVAEQEELVRKGFSKTMKSKHLTGEAVDIAFVVRGKLSYSAALYRRLYRIAKPIPYIIWPYKDLNWGWDKPHFRYDPEKEVDTLKGINIKKLFKEIWGVDPARGDELYWIQWVHKRKAGSLQELRDDMKNRYDTVYPGGKFSRIGNAIWQIEKFRFLGLT